MSAVNYWHGQKRSPPGRGRNDRAFHQREAPRAHRFYLREGYEQSHFRFTKACNMSLTLTLTGTGGAQGVPDGAASARPASEHGARRSIAAAMQRRSKV